MATVDGNDNEIWVYLNLETGAEVTPSSPDDDPSWDRSNDSKFERMVESQVREAAIAKLAETDFDSLTVAPAGEYLSDAEDSDDSDADPDYVFLGETPWYDYDLANHTLSPADVVYVVRGVSGDYYKVKMVGYYDEAGTEATLPFVGENRATRRHNTTDSRRRNGD